MTIYSMNRLKKMITQSSSRSRTTPQYRTMNGELHFISNLLSYQIITEEQAKLLKVATSDNVLIVPHQYRDELRASIFKNMLINLV